MTRPNGVFTEWLEQGLRDGLDPVGLAARPRPEHADAIHALVDGAAVPRMARRLSLGLALAATAFFVGGALAVGAATGSPNPVDWSHRIQMVFAPAPVMSITPAQPSAAPAATAVPQPSGQGVTSPGRTQPTPSLRPSSPGTCTGQCEKVPACTPGSTATPLGCEPTPSPLPTCAPGTTPGGPCAPKAPARCPLPGSPLPDPRLLAPAEGCSSGTATLVSYARS